MRGSEKIKSKILHFRWGNRNKEKGEVNIGHLEMEKENEKVY